MALPRHQDHFVDATFPDLSDVHVADLPWPGGISIAMGIFSLSVGVVIALQRHEFTAPNLQLLVIVAVIGPWVLDMFPRVKRYCDDRHLILAAQIAWSLVVLVGVFWLIAAYHGPNDFTPFMLTILIGEMTSTAGPRFGAVVWAASVAGIVLYVIVGNFEGMAIWAFAFTIGWMGGFAFRRQLEITMALTLAQAQLATKAIEEERHRLARDVHDLVAHSLAVTMLQLSGARLALRDGATEEALEALQEAETAGRQAMAEIHRTVGLLGSGESAQAQRATPNAAALPDLVAEFRRAGLTVDFRLDGDLMSVPLAIGLASYRMVQESLSNAVKHAPGAPVRLEVDVGPHDIHINTVNAVVAGSRTGPVGGNGLRGMAERAELLGGRATANNGDGTWKVDATIPWEPAQA
jgi:signal transduction histidine kinase